MKRLAEILALSLLLSLVLVPAAVAEVEEGPAPEVLPTAVVAAMETEASDMGSSAPDAMPTRPDPVFLAGSGAGGAGGVKTGLVNGESSGLPTNQIMYEDHLCCPYGANSCYCSEWSGRFCDPIGCPNLTQETNCGGTYW